MNIQQMEYIIAVDTLKHFARAAEFCCVTQPTLSMMIQRLEDELGVRIFDRMKHPVETTPVGKLLVEQARISLRHFNLVREIADNEQGIVHGSFKLGIIPTIASSLVPVLLQKRNDDQPTLDLRIKECTTTALIGEILGGTLDGGILAGPTGHLDLSEYPLYYEKFYAYVSPSDALFDEKEIDLEHIDIDHLWLLANEHCLRGQIERLCRLKAKTESPSGFKYESGSIETLINVVDLNSGITIIPEMHAIGLDEDRQGNLRMLKNRTAVREVCMVVSVNYVRRTMLNMIMEIVRQSIPKSMQNPDLKQFVVDIDR